MNNEIIFLGTGNALATRCFNTCFAIRNSDGQMLMVDAGGGNGILRQLELAGIERTEIQDLFVTHAHTDHILGVVWMMRMALQFQQPNPLRIWSHRKVLDVLTYICQQILPAKEAARIGTVVELHELHDGDQFEAAGIQLQCFDIRSTKELQYGFTAQLADGQRLVCLGDEPYNGANEKYVRGADWLMSEAFCLYADRDRFLPYEKHHSTVLDAARLAESIGVKNLILYHTEDQTLATRRERYTAEARSAYQGNVFVPDDLERIQIYKEDL
jgi:ribonuclease Z